MAVDMFLKLDGIDGESSDAKHKNEIEILSFSWGASQQGSFASDGRGGGPKADAQSLSIVHKIDIASPSLLYHACTGTHIKQAVLAVRKRGDVRSSEDYLTIKLSDCLVSSFQAGGSSASDEVPLEQVSFNYSKIEIEYKPQNAAGQLGEGVSWACGAGSSLPVRSTGQGK
jgi:type VI secretion system secreted protein Hcp